MPFPEKNPLAVPADYLYNRLIQYRKERFIKADSLPPEHEWAYRREEWTFGLLKRKLPYLQEFRSMEHFKQELVAYPDSYNNRRIRTKPKGLPPAIYRQQALSAA